MLKVLEIWGKVSMKKNYEEDHSDVLIAPRLMSLPPPPRRLLLSQIPMARAVVLTIPGDTFYSMANSYGTFG